MYPCDQLMYRACATCLSCFPTHLRVLSIQPLGPRTLHPSLMNFFLYAERGPFSPFLKLVVLTKSHIVFFVKSLNYLLASFGHYCLAPPARPPARQLRLISH